MDTQASSCSYFKIKINKTRTETNGVFSSVFLLSLLSRTRSPWYTENKQYIADKSQK